MRLGTAMPLPETPRRRQTPAVLRQSMPRPLSQAIDGRAGQVADAAHAHGAPPYACQCDSRHARVFCL